MESSSPTVAPTVRSHSPQPSDPKPPKESSSEDVRTEDMPEKGAKVEAVEDPENNVGLPDETSTPRRINKRKANIQYAVMCWCLFLAGWNDGSTGPLLPRMQKAYHVGYAVVSLIFVFNCVGFVTGAAANIALTDRFGFGTVMVIGSVAQVIAYALESPAPPFPVFVLGYCINGFGLALQDAGANGYVASLDSSATKMGILHAVYGLGALVSPLVATKFSQLPRWSFYYLTSLGVALLDTLFLAAVIRFRSQDECLVDIGQVPTDHSTSNSEENKYKQIFRLRPLHLLASFTLVYVGVEVTVGGWIVTYILNAREGGPSSGYISSGFFGGLTLGRVALLWFNKLVGERRVVFLYILLAIGFELVIWFVPSIIGDAVAVSFIGMLLGPIYPIIMNHSGRVLPPWLLTGCIGWIAGFGQAGSAFIPFLTGLLASREGIQSLQPLLVAMMGFMFCLWALVPNTPRCAG